VRYGENPHQRGALYRTVADSPLLSMEQLQGKELSFNNYLDIVGAFTLARDLGVNGVSIIKHTNPCGAAWCGDVLHSFRRALATDKVSAFGGIVAVNGTINDALAGELAQMFLEVVIARDLDDDARAAFAKKKNLRVITIPEKHWTPPAHGALAVMVQDIVLYQEEDLGFPELDSLQVVTKKSPNDFEMMALKMAWKVA
jgi:phosphoribosylaminoimidazolecarboxamide formyltransferase/IMP cyclohydrolase